MSAAVQLDGSVPGTQVLQNALAMRMYSPQLAMLQSLAPAAHEVRTLSTQVLEVTRSNSKVHAQELKGCMAPVHSGISSCHGHTY